MALFPSLYSGTAFDPVFWPCIGMHVALRLTLYSGPALECMWPGIGMLSMTTPSLHSRDGCDVIYARGLIGSWPGLAKGICITKDSKDGRF